MKRGSALLLAALVLLAAPKILRLASAHLFALDLLVPGWMPAVRAVTHAEITLNGTTADLYRGGAPPRGGLVLVPGLSRTGKDHPAFLRAEAPRPIGILGFSFGAGPALLAAADSSIRNRVDVVGSFGGYWDLAHVIAFITTGWYEEDGDWRQRTQQSYNRWKLLAALAPYAADPAKRARLERLVDRRLANPTGDVSVDMARLGLEGRQLLTLVENRQRDRVADLLVSLNPRIRERLQRLSPSSAITLVRARLLIAHGRDDDSIPYTESVRLARAAPNLGRLVIFDGFTR